MANRVKRTRDGMFFLSPDTKKALSRLGRLDDLVIYCGAGVTIDQTGVSWTDLVREVFTTSAALADVDDRYASIEYLLGVIDDPRQLASVVTQAYKADAATENEFLMTALVPILYTKNTWSTGQILRNVAMLASLAAAFGRNVTIITTNYDSYIEQEIDDRFFKQLGDLPGDRVPGVYRSVYTPDDERPTRVDMVEAQNGAGEIELIYLHGRVDRHGSVEGRLVLTEDSYAQTRTQSVRILCEHFGRKDGKRPTAVLIVGASLNDGPLIEALALTRESGIPKGGIGKQVRVALTDLPLTNRQLDTEFTSKAGTDVTTSTIRKTLALRGDHLGTTILWPASHAQSAQFLEELRVDLMARKRHNRPDAYSHPELGLAYDQRLDRWSTAFMQSATMTDQVFVHEHLRLTVEAIKTKLQQKYDYKSADETLRLELWARVKPTRERRLTLVGNSTGPLLDRDALRHETYDTLTNSSILAFLEGRPLLKTSSGLGLDPALRWKTFFTMPIFVHVNGEGDNGGGRIPVGVITLASTLSMERDENGKQSVFARLEPKRLRRLRSKTLIPAGKLLLSPALEAQETQSAKRVSRR